MTIENKTEDLGYSGRERPTIGRFEVRVGGLPRKQRKAWMKKPLKPDSSRDLNAFAWYSYLFFGYLRKP